MAEKEEIIEVYLTPENKIIIKDMSAGKKIYERSFFGTFDEKKNIIELLPEEAILLFERNKIKIIDEITKKEVSLTEFLERYGKNKELWENYLIYQDLRGRGYIVRKGISNEIIYTVYPRGAKPYEVPPKFYVSKLVEGKDMLLQTLRIITQISKSSNIKLVIAVLDRQGDVTYYSVHAMPL